jgi:Icc-related predicted phosphoesterase
MQEVRVCPYRERMPVPRTWGELKTILMATSIAKRVETAVRSIYGRLMDLVILGDTHELHHEVEVPAGDLLIFTGDFTMFSKNLSAIESFNEWLGDLPHRWKLVVPGNHEFFLEADPDRRFLISNATVLIDEAIEINGLKVYGSPMTPLYGGAFGKVSAVDRYRHWERIPSDVNVLITHGPPLGALDRSPGQLEPMGDPELMARVKELPSLLLHCFGHVHGAYGTIEEDGVLFVNAALMGSLGAIERRPVILRMKASP